jgi:predicted DNA-binding transcriptional regulator AlpA
VHDPLEIAGFFVVCLPQVLERIPISWSTWWSGSRGALSQTVKLSTRITVWSEQDINDFVEDKIEQAKQAEAR